MKSVARLIESVADRFAAADLVYGHGTDNAWDEAVALVLHVTGFADDRSALAIAVEPDTAAAIEVFANERIARKVPLAYLLKQCTYVGMRFEVEPGVMVPRSPIGRLLCDGLQPWVTSPQAIVDLCAGSGCLGIVAAHVYPEAAVTLVEIDETALAVARRNVARHELTGRVDVVAGDVATVVFNRRWDVILANPPYVDARCMADLPAEFRAEPELGLRGGEDGLDVVATILQRAGDWLTDDGVLVCEVGASAAAFERRYPDLPVVWLDLAHGGEGVFLLERERLNSQTPRG